GALTDSADLDANRHFTGSDFLEEAGASERAIPHHSCARSRPSDQRVVGEERAPQLPLQVAITDQFEVPADIEGGGEARDQPVNGDGRADVLDDVAFGPDARQA